MASAEEYKMLHGNGGDSNGRELPRADKEQQLATDNAAINAPMFTSSFQGLGMPLPPGSDPLELYRLSAAAGQYGAGEQGVLL